MNRQSQHVKYNPVSFWSKVVSDAMMKEKIVLDRIDINGEEIPHPSISGMFQRSVGELKGQVSDWRRGIDGRDESVHVVEFTDRFEVHLDHYDPYKKPIQHLLVKISGYMVPWRLGPHGQGGIFLPVWKIR